VNTFNRYCVSPHTLPHTLLPCRKDTNYLHTVELHAHFNANPRAKRGIVWITFFQPPPVCVYTHTCTHTRTHSYEWIIFFQTPPVCVYIVCVYICVDNVLSTAACVWIHPYTHTYTHTYTRTHTHTHACMYICTHVCVCVYIDRYLYTQVCVCVYICACVYT